MDNIKDPDQIKEHLPQDSLDCQNEAPMKSIDESSTAVKSNNDIDKDMVQEADLADSSTNTIGEIYKAISDHAEVVQTSGKENEVNESSKADDFKDNTNEQGSVKAMQPSEMVCNTSEPVQIQIPQPECVPMVASSAEPTVQPSETVCTRSESVHTKTPQPESGPMVPSSAEPTVQPETVCNTSESVHTKIPQPEGIPMVASSAEPTVQPETVCNTSESVHTKIPQPEGIPMVVSIVEPTVQPSETVCTRSESVHTKIPQPEGIPMVVSSVEPTVQPETDCNTSESVHTKIPQPEGIPMVVSSVEPTVQPSETVCNTSESVHTKIPQLEGISMVASSVEPTVQPSETGCNSSEDVPTVAANAEPSMQSLETVRNLPEPNQAEINQAEDVPMVALGVQPKTQSSEMMTVAEPNQTEIIKPEDVPIVVSPGESNMESTENECIMMEPYQTDMSLGETNTVEELIANATIVIPDDVSFNSNTAEPSSSLNATGLSLLAQYDSDDDSDEVQEVPVTAPYQNRFVEINSDTESDSDPDTDSDDSEVEVRRAIDLGILGAGHGTDDGEENVRNSRTPKVKGELYLSDLPPIQDLHITVNEEECSELGKIQSIVEQLVIVNSLPGTVPLDLDTVLFLDKGNKVLGEVFDVLGQVSDPMYCVRFNSNKEIKEKGIEVGQTVYVAPRTQHTQFIVLANLMKTKGSDASWENDIEPPERYLDYSDDEEEHTARRTLRNKGRPMEADDEAPKRQRPAETTYTNPGCSQPPRPYRRNIGPWQPHYQPPSNYNMAGGSWHSNYYQNYAHPHYPHHQYRMPIYPQYDYRYPPPQTMPHPPGAPHPGLVPNPYAMFPPPQLMQQPLFPQPPHQPPPPPPPHGGY